VILGPESLFDRQNQLWEHGEDFSSVLTGVEELVAATVGQKQIGLSALSESLEENGKIEMVIEQFELLNLPGNLRKVIFSEISYTFLLAPEKSTAMGRSPLS